MLGIPGALCPERLLLSAQTLASRDLGLGCLIEQIQTAIERLEPLPPVPMPRNLGRVGLDHGGERVREIQTTLVSKVSDQPPSIDTRFKPPHVTLARCKKNARKPQARQIQRALERLEGASLPDQDRFSSVHLVRSSLTPSGPVYENLFEIGLASET